VKDTVKSTGTLKLGDETFAVGECAVWGTIKLKYEADKQFRIHWTGESYLHGVEGHGFALDALATLTSVSLSSDVETESDVDDAEIVRIFATVFANGDFDQQPAAIERIDEDGLVKISFKAEFTPK
jgi:hypothetical protein